MRINQFLARCGLGSRRKVEALVVAGRVKKNAKVISTLAEQVDPDIDMVEVDGVRVMAADTYEYWLCHKPKGMVTTMSDPQKRKTVAGMVPTTTQVFPVGRLDMDTEGLLIFTNDGEFAQRLTKPTSYIEKEYVVIVDALLSKESLSRINSGFDLGDIRLKPIIIQLAGANKEGSWYTMILTEGKNRQIRRVMSACHREVVRLVRVRIGRLRIGGLAEGACRKLELSEINDLNQRGV
jgi:23S rRNA pseudouridine2605 synthase